MKKKYSRKALIRFFEKLPPRSKPCKGDYCPIGFFLGIANSYEAAKYDKRLACAVDGASLSAGSWDDLTAARIVKIARSLP